MRSEQGGEIVCNGHLQDELAQKKPKENSSDDNDEGRKGGRWDLLRNDLGLCAHRRGAASLAKLVGTNTILLLGSKHDVQ